MGKIHGVTGTYGTPTSLPMRYRLDTVGMASPSPMKPKGMIGALVMRSRNPKRLARARAGNDGAAHADRLDRNLHPFDALRDLVRHRRNVADTAPAAAPKALSGCLQTLAVAVKTATAS